MKNGSKKLGAYGRCMLKRGSLAKYNLLRPLNARSIRDDAKSVKYFSCLPGFTSRRQKWMRAPETVI